VSKATDLFKGELSFIYLYEKDNNIANYLTSKSFTPEEHE